MKPLSGRLKRVVVAFGVALVLVLATGAIASAILYTKLAARTEPVGMVEPNALDAQEAKKKLKLFEEARKTNRDGFVRLSQEEFNSLLQERYFAPPSADVPTAVRGDCELVKARLSLGKDALVWYAWVRRTWNRWGKEVIWQRTIRLKGAAGQRAVEVEAMQVGSVRIPPRYWPLAQKWLGPADEKLTEPYHWLMSLPGLEIQTNELSRDLELRLYTAPQRGKSGPG